MPVRKNCLFMSTTERGAFFEAVLKMKANIVNPLAPTVDQYSVYDQFVFHHLGVFTVIDPTTGFTYNAGHGAAAFLSWHRELLRRFEIALQAEVPGVMLPYWDWSAAIFTVGLMGPNGGVGGVGGGVVRTGLFAGDRPGTGTNAAFALPGYYPATLQGWRIRPDLDDSADGIRLRRFLGTAPGDVLPGFSDVDAILAATPPTTFRSRLESGTVNISSHNEVHRYIGGHMGAACSPNDPIFWLHHCNIDRLWAMWQLDGHAGASFFPASAAFGHGLTSAMWPWTGATVYALPVGLPAYYLPDFSTEPARTNQDLLDHHGVGYAYDTEPVVGVALDRSGSMTGMTSDPLAASAPISKWELGKKGVQHFLADCQAAYTARAAYVIGGVTTFTSSAGPVVLPVLSAQPYGLVKAGAYDPASVTTALNALNAVGGTPLAAAMSRTHDDVVRPPSNASPPDDVRYLAMLTDGKETVPPNLATLATGGFGQTLVFGMGLGNGTSWDGVDYATIQTIVEKGRSPSTAASRVFQGENVGVIDKFFTNTVAQAIGFTMAIDPRFDLFPGEHAHVPFYVTSADEALMITVLRGDPRDEPWHVALYDARGLLHDASDASDIAFTFQRRDGRDTIFVQRNGADRAEWVGRWHLHIAYARPGETAPHGGHGHAPPGTALADTHGGLSGMAMMNTWDLLLPAGAPPLRGVTFAGFDKAARARVSTRRIPSASRLPSALGAPAIENENEAGAASGVLATIYMKTTLQVSAQFDRDARFASDPLRLDVAIEDTLGGRIYESRALGRLVAPKTSPSVAFLDTKAIPLEARRKFLVAQADGVRFDQLGFLAEYERSHPGVFAPRDEALVFEKRSEAVHVAQITDTRVPGLYQSGVYVEGLLQRGDDPPEWFARVLSVDRGLATRIDPERSRPTLHWVGPSRFVMTALPQDRAGHLLAPSSVGQVVVRLGGQEIAAEAVPTVDGSVRFDGHLHEGAAAVAPDGCCVDGDTHVHALHGEPILVRAHEALRFSLEIAGHTLAVRSPAFALVRGKLHLAASATALALPVEDRVVFDNAAEAIRAGHEVPAVPAHGHAHEDPLHGHGADPSEPHAHGGSAPAGPTPSAKARPGASKKR